MSFLLFVLKSVAFGLLVWQSEEQWIQLRFAESACDWHLCHLQTIRMGANHILCMCILLSYSLLFCSYVIGCVLQTIAILAQVARSLVS